MRNASVGFDDTDDLDYSSDASKSTNTDGGETGEEINPSPFHVFKFIGCSKKSNEKVNEKYSAGEIVSNDDESVNFFG